MIKSMTGFASLTRDDDLATITVTVKAVNHRFLDLQLRVPGSLAAAETRIRSLVQSRVSRGRVEVSVSIQQRRTTAVEVELNQPFLDALKLAIDRAREAGYVEGSIAPSDLLRFPQALTIREKAEDAAEDPAPLFNRVEEAIGSALGELDTMRIREGGYLQDRSRRASRSPWRSFRAGGNSRGRRNFRPPGQAARKGARATGRCPGG